MKILDPRTTRAAFAALVLQTLLLAGTAAPGSAETRPDDIRQALHNGRLPEVEAYLAGGGSPSATLEDGQPLLSAAAWGGSAAVAQKLLDAGANPYQPDRYGSLAIESAISRNQPQLIPVFIKAGIDPNYSGHWSTLLMSASASASPETIEALLEAGADPNYRNPYGDSAFTFARRSTNPAAVRELLVKHGGDPGKAKIWELLSNGLGIGEQYLAITFIEEHASDPAALGDLLRAAAARGRSTIVHYCIEKGVAADEPDRGGHTALMYAARQGFTETVEELLARGADPGRSSKLGETALHWAAEQGKTGTVRALLAHGADRTRRDLLGRLAVDIAADRAKIVKNSSNQQYDAVVELLTGDASRGPK